MARCIRKPIDLVLQSNKLRFVGRDGIRTDGFASFSFKKTDPGSTKSQKLSSDGTLFREDTYKELRRIFKNNRSYSASLKKYKDALTCQESVQNITFIHIRDNGVSDTNFYATDVGPEEWLARMYLKIPLGLSTEDATSILIRKHSFCDFPHGEDLDDLRSHSEDDPYLEKMTPTKGVAAITWLHLYRKILRLSDIIRNISEVTPDDRDFLQEEVRNNVLKIEIPRNDFAYREIRDFDGHEGMGIGDDFMSDFTENKNDQEHVDGYRIFGHVALCCLELLTDIDKNHVERFCEYSLCRKPLPYGIHGNKKTCDAECELKYRNEQRRNSRAKKPKKELD